MKKKMAKVEKKMDLGFYKMGTLWIQPCPTSTDCGVKGIHAKVPTDCPLFGQVSCNVRTFRDIQGTVCL